MEDFCGKLNCSLEKVSKIIEVATRLYNFIIDTQGLDMDNENINRFNNEDINLTKKEQDAGFVLTEKLISIKGTSIFVSK